MQVGPKLEVSGGTADPQADLQINDSLQLIKGGTCDHSQSGHSSTYLNAPLSNNQPQAQQIFQKWQITKVSNPSL